jgi:hypothetical protein
MLRLPAIAIARETDRQGGRCRRASVVWCSLADARAGWASGLAASRRLARHVSPRPMVQTCKRRLTVINWPFY